MNIFYKELIEKINQKIITELNVSLYTYTCKLNDLQNEDVVNKQETLRKINEIKAYRDIFTNPDKIRNTSYLNSTDLISYMSSGSVRFQIIRFVAKYNPDNLPDLNFGYSKYLSKELISAITLAKDDLVKSMQCLGLDTSKYILFLEKQKIQEEKLAETERKKLEKTKKPSDNPEIKATPIFDELVTHYNERKKRGAENFQNEKNMK